MKSTKSETAPPVPYWTLVTMQAPRCATFDEWHHNFMKSIEDLNLLYGKMSWNQICLSILICDLEMMENKDRLMRNHMKLQSNLPQNNQIITWNPDWHSWSHRQDGYTVGHNSSTCTPESQKTLKVKLLHQGVAEMSWRWGASSRPVMLGKSHPVKNRNLSRLISILIRLKKKANPTVRGIHQCSKQIFQSHHPVVAGHLPTHFFFVNLMEKCYISVWKKGFFTHIVTWIQCHHPLTEQTF